MEGSPASPLLPVHICVRLVGGALRAGSSARSAWSHSDPALGPSACPLWLDRRFDVEDSELLARDQLLDVEENQHMIALGGKAGNVLDVHRSGELGRGLHFIFGQP